MALEIRFENDLMLERIPVQWIPKFEMFIPDLPNFPLVYVHVKKNSERIFGFPISVNFIDFQNGECNPVVKFLCNVNLQNDEEANRIVSFELSERFGISNKVTKADISDACNGDKKLIGFFSKLWDDVIVPDHGNAIPYGRYFEEFYSIIRFVSAWNTAGRGGRQQELRQLYWFLREYGRRISIEIPDLSFYQFYLLPTYEEVKSKKIMDFPKISRLLEIVEKIWSLEFTKEVKIQNKTVFSMTRSWPKTRDSFVRYMLENHEKKGNMTPEESHELGLLVDMFDRFPLRTAGFVWCVMSIHSLGYENWSKEFLDEFYLSLFENNNTIGIYPKVVACFLQQGFGNQEAIPMDSWILSFVKHPIGIFGPRKKPRYSLKDQKLWEHKEFFSGFKNRAKLERLMWLVSQSKKVNMNPVFDMIWCIRYGTTGDDAQLREQNPIACYQCTLRENCKGYESIEDEYVYIHEGAVDEKIRNSASQQGCDFICITQANVPKKIERLNKSRTSRKWLFLDEFSGLRMQPSFTTSLKGAHKVKDLMKDLTSDPSRNPFSSN